MRPLTITLQTNTTLDEWLRRFPFSRTDIHLLKMERRLCVNGQKVLQDVPLQAGDQLTIDWAKEEPADIPADDQPLNILYEDEVVLVVDKPYDLLVHPDGTGRMSLDNRVAGYYRKTSQHHKVYHVHRLDRQTSGAILYVKESFLMAYFDQALASKAIQRTYRAKVSGLIDQDLTIDKPIGADRHHNNRYRISQTGKPAITHVHPLDHDNSASLVECRLETGRTHQIRVHLSAIGHPVIGDALYGGRKSKRMMLHSYRLRFIHPLSGKTVTVISPIEW